jgi:hypothetical protein
LSRSKYSRRKVTIALADYLFYGKGDIESEIEEIAGERSLEFVKELKELKPYIAACREIGSRIKSNKTLAHREICDKHGVEYFDIRYFIKQLTLSQVQILDIDSSVKYHETVKYHAEKNM